MAELEEEVGPPANGKPPADEWRTDKKGRQYVPRTDGRPGVINRQGEETIDEARKRDSAPKPEDRRPRRKPKTPPKPSAPPTVDLKALERSLAEALKSPALICAAFGDEWAANHFTSRGPYLARNLVNAAEHNPWLRRKLEEAATGEDAMMKVMGLIGVGGGLVLYLVPPAIYFLNLPVPDKAREMLDVPPRRPLEDHVPPTASPPARPVTA